MFPFNRISPVIFSSSETSWTSCGREAIFWRTAASPDAAFSRSCSAFTSSSVWKQNRVNHRQITNWTVRMLYWKEVWLHQLWLHRRRHGGWDFGSKGRWDMKTGMKGRRYFLKSYQLGSRRARVAGWGIVSIVIVFLVFILLDLLIASFQGFSLFCTNTRQQISFTPQH